MVQTLHLSALTAAQGFRVQGDAFGDRAGCSVASAGDVNGDGLDDVIVGAPYGRDGGYDAGQAYVIYGRTDTRGRIDLGALSVADGFVIQGDRDSDRAGSSVASAGDMNGDGLDDMLVGASSADAGKAYVIYGTTGPRGRLDLGAFSR